MTNKIETINEIEFDSQIYKEEYEEYLKLKGLDKARWKNGRWCALISTFSNDPDYWEGEYIGHKLEITKNHVNGDFWGYVYLKTDSVLIGVDPENEIFDEIQVDYDLTLGRGLTYSDNQKIGFYCPGGGDIDFDCVLTECKYLAEQLQGLDEELNKFKKMFNVMPKKEIMKNKNGHCHNPKSYP